MGEQYLTMKYKEGFTIYKVEDGWVAVLIGNYFITARTLRQLVEILVNKFEPRKRNAKGKFQPNS